MTSEQDWQRRIGEAFETLEHQVDSRMDVLESKLDTILQHLKGYKG